MEIVLLLIGTLLGLFSSLFLAPLLEGKSQGFIVKLLGSTIQQKSLSLAGKWDERWWVEGEKDKRIDEDKNVTVKQFGKHISAKFKSFDGVNYMIGRVEQGSFITGTWHNEYRGGTYHGAFQLYISPPGKLMVGKWIGFSKTNEIQSGVWEWKRPYLDQYPSELAATDEEA